MKISLLLWFKTNNRRGTIYSALAFVVCLASFQFANVPQASADDCAVVASAAPPKLNNFNIHYSVTVTKNSCRRPVRAAEYDYITTGVPTGPPPAGPYTYYGWDYGNIVTAAGAQSQNDTHFFAIDAHCWGYEEQVGGK